MSESPTPTIYQLKVVLMGISPMIWRRLLVSSDCTVTDLHYILQIAMGWSDDHLNRFRIHGIEYGVHMETVSQLPDDIFVEDPTEKHKKLIQKIEAFETYIRNNAALIPNYAERFRYGETISTAFAESTINQVVSKRMVKKRQMRWNQGGAHLLLQLRTRVLNGELRDEFRKWYPSFDHDGEELPLAA
jgi:hypothetical protein